MRSRSNGSGDRRLAIYYDMAAHASRCTGHYWQEGRGGVMTHDCAVDRCDDGRGISRFLTFYYFAMRSAFSRFDISYIRASFSRGTLISAFFTVFNSNVIERRL